jgi:hypothetical protein
MVVGASRFVFCEECEEHTDQSLKHLSKNGMGEPIAQVWRCLKGHHYVGFCPAQCRPS